MGGWVYSWKNVTFRRQEMSSLSKYTSSYSVTENNGENTEQRRVDRVSSRVN